MQPPGKTPVIINLPPLPNQMEFSAQSDQFKLVLKEWLTGTASRDFSIFSVFRSLKLRTFSVPSLVSLYMGVVFNLVFS